MYSCAGLAEARGCPIRIFTDQSLFAAPHDFSQRTTSFIASQCQGIHQMLLSRLMLSLPMSILAWSSAFADFRGPDLGRSGGTDTRSKKDLYVLDLPAAERSSSCVPRQSATQANSPFRAHSLACLAFGPCKQIPSFTMSISKTPAQYRAAKLVQEVLNGHMPEQNNNTVMEWWSQTGSNRRPEACKATALPTELWPRLTHMTGNRSLQDQPQSGGPGKTRTSDLTLIKRAL